jgi:hypothetical protein
MADVKTIIALISLCFAFLLFLGLLYIRVIKPDTDPDKTLYSKMTFGFIIAFILIADSISLSNKSDLNRNDIINVVFVGLGLLGFIFIYIQPGLLVTSLVCALLTTLLGSIQLVAEDL